MLLLADFERIDLLQLWLCPLTALLEKCLIDQRVEPIVVARPILEHRLLLLLVEGVHDVVLILLVGQFSWLVVISHSALGACLLHLTLRLSEQLVHLVLLHQVQFLLLLQAVLLEELGVLVFVEVRSRLQLLQVRRAQVLGVGRQLIQICVHQVDAIRLGLQVHLFLQGTQLLRLGSFVAVLTLSLVRFLLDFVKFSSLFLVKLKDEVWVPLRFLGNDWHDISF